jgi:hypothetical protein
MYGLQGAGSAELDIEALIQLQAAEYLEATHGQIRFQIGDMTPTEGPDAAGVDARSFRRDLVALQQGHASAVLSQVAGG